jgi:1-acyl-sn-glycerol-3-phosphate acyltransferase
MRKQPANRANPALRSSRQAYPTPAPATEARATREPLHAARDFEQRLPPRDGHANRHAVRAGLLRTALILARTTYATLRISVATIWDAYRGRYDRNRADARLRWWSRRLLDLVGLRCRVFGAENLAPASGRPVILMSNHQSLYDIPLIFDALPGSIRMLTKKELFSVPIWGRGMRAAEFVSIDRKDRAQAFRDLASARAKMEDGIVLWVAPEGTRSRDGRLGDLKKGAFMLAIETGAWIVPIGIRGASAVLPPGSLRGANLGCSAEVHVGMPIDASAYTGARRDELMSEVARRICRLAAIEPRAARLGRTEGVASAAGRRAQASK